MTAPKSLQDSERKNLLHDLTALKSDDDDAIAHDPKWFLPLEAHARALRHETLVVRGGRGAGKTALFQYLGHAQKNPKLVEGLGSSLLASTSWVEGFSQASMHPSAEIVARFGKSVNDDRCRLFWFAWLCARISSETNVSLPPGPLATVNAKPVFTPDDLAGAAEGQLADLTVWLDGIDRARSAPVIVTYDYLDRFLTGGSSSSRELTASLLAMWLSLADRYRQIRPKIFVREDLFQKSLSAFPDASKLDARSTSIEWRVEDLYRVLIKHMANTSEALKGWIEGSLKRIPLVHKEALGWMPPESLPETGKESQKSFIDHLAGEQMGTGSKKGFTYRWIPNRLQDAHTRVVPRSILSLIRNAADFALTQGPQAPRLRLLAPVELQGALEKTSNRRVQELREEFPVVARLESLHGKSVMLGRNVAIAALSRQLPDVKDDYGSDGEAVLRTLIELGVMSERSDGRLDVPDIYRYGFNILRKGGVRRPR